MHNHTSGFFIKLTFHVISGNFLIKIHHRSGARSKAQSQFEVNILKLISGASEDRIVLFCYLLMIVWPIMTQLTTFLISKHDRLVLRN
jgi:hypothetical protein